MVLELNKTQKIREIDASQPNVVAQLSDNYHLDSIMTKMRMNGELEDVLVVIQKIEKKFPKYNDSFWYKYIFPGPCLLVSAIENEFNSNPITKPLFKYLHWDKVEIRKCQLIYSANIFLLIASLAATLLALQGFYLSLLIVIVFISFLYIQVKFFEHTIKHVGFVQIYTLICNVLENSYREHCRYVERVIAFPEQIQQRWQEMEKNKIFDNLTQEEKKNRQKLELDTALSLQDLTATMAIAQANTDAEVQHIKNNTNLKYRAEELRILDESQGKQHLHELALSSLDSMGSCLVEQAKAIATDDKEKRRIQYQLHLLNGIRGEILSKGEAAMSSESMYEGFNKMMEMMTNPESTD